MCRPINIFLGSSIVELKDERKDLSREISEDFEHLLRKDNINVHFVKCENNHSGNDGSRDQDYYNQLLKDCEYSVFLFKTRLGTRTAEEFSIARELQKTKKHVIFVYFLHTPEETKEPRLKDFRDGLDIEWEECETISDVRNSLTLGLLDRLGIRIEKPKSREDKLNQFIELRQDLHSEIDNMLAEIEKIKAIPSDSIVAMIMNVIGIYRQADHWASATNYDKEQYCELLFNYADFLDKYGLYYDSREVYIRHISYAEDVYGIEHIKTAISYNNLGEIYRKTGDYSKARDYYTRALTIIEKTPGADNPNNATIYNNIGLTYYNQGLYVKALEYYQKALDIHKKTEPEKHHMFANYLNNIGSAYWMKGDKKKALECHFKALEIQKEVSDKDDSEMAFTYNNIGLVLDDEEKHEEALNYYQKALAIRKKVLGTKHPNTATLYHNIGFSYYKMKKYDIALVYMNKAHAVFQDKLGPMHPSTITVQKCIANVETSMRKSKCLSSKED